MLKFQEYQKFQDNWEPCNPLNGHTIDAVNVAKYLGVTKRFQINVINL